MKNKCISCDGTGITPKWLLSGRIDERTECTTCDGTGFDFRYKDQIVCPYCGKDNDPCEFDKSGEYQCGYCEKNFHIEVNYSVDYSSSRVDCLNDKTKHKWKHEKWYNEGLPTDGKYYYRCTACSKYEWIEKEPT